MQVVFGSKEDMFFVDEPDIKAVLNDRENQWIGTTTTLKSTLKKEDKKGARKKDHVSFEMSNIQNVRKSVFMYGGRYIFMKPCYISITVIVSQVVLEQKTSV